MLELIIIPFDRWALVLDIGSIVPVRHSRLSNKWRAGKGLAFLLRHLSPRATLLASLRSG